MKHILSALSKKILITCALLSVGSSVAISSAQSVDVSWVPLKPCVISISASTCDMFGSNYTEPNYLGDIEKNNNTGTPIYLQNKTLADKVYASLKNVMIIGAKNGDTGLRNSFDLNKGESYSGREKLTYGANSIVISKPDGTVLKTETVTATCEPGSMWYERPNLENTELGICIAVDPVTKQAFVPVESFTVNNCVIQEGESVCSSNPSVKSYPKRYLSTFTSNKDVVGKFGSTYELRTSGGASYGVTTGDINPQTGAWIVDQRYYFGDDLPAYQRQSLSGFNGKYITYGVNTISLREGSGSIPKSTDHIVGSATAIATCAPGLFWTRWIEPGSSIVNTSYNENNSYVTYDNTSGTHYRGGEYRCEKLISGGVINGELQTVNRAAPAAIVNVVNTPVVTINGVTTTTTNTNTSTANLPSGCFSTSGYSSITGVSCASTVSISGTLPAGCTSTTNYSPITGQKCVNSGMYTYPTNPTTGNVTSNNSSPLVSGLSVVSTSSSLQGVVIKWIAPNISITRYKVYVTEYFSNGSTSGKNLFAYIPSTATDYFISPLKVGVRYDISLQPVDTNGNDLQESTVSNVYLNSSLNQTTTISNDSIPNITAPKQGDTDPKIGGNCFQVPPINLKQGDNNDSVAQLQGFLIGKGFLNTDATGYFGPLTLKAVQNYQSSQGIINTGFVGPLTRGAVNNECWRMDTISQ